MNFPLSMELRKLLSICILVFFYLNNVAIVEAGHRIYPALQSKIAVTVDYSLRTGYHFQPPKHWINDPNGPMWFNGYYHLFYQYNPLGSVWGNIFWAHSVSKDLVNWRALEAAIFPSVPFDIEGCWSGSATIVPNKGPVILYTGLDPKKRQIQNYAVPANISDPFLRKWIKPADNPVVEPDASMNASAFRDPTTAWFNKGKWKIVVGSRRGTVGTAELYTSKDFLNWDKSDHLLHSVPDTGMWECLDFYPISVSGKEGLDTSVVGENVKHVFKVSLDLTRYDYYTVGKYDTTADKYVPDKGFVDGWKGLRYDYGNFYASKTFYDPLKKRRILWGWANESDPVNADVQKGWAGIQLIPRTVLLDPSGQHLIQWPIQEIETLRTAPISMEKKPVKLGETVEFPVQTAHQADVEATFSFVSLDKAEPFNTSWANEDAEQICRQRGSNVQGGVGPFGLLTLATKKLEEFTPVFFRIFKFNDPNKKYVVLMCSDARPSSLNEKNWRPSYGGFVPINIEKEGNKISLRSLMDNSVVESFGGGGRTCISSRVYPQKATVTNNGDVHVFVFNNGTEPITVESLKGWNMNKPVDMNREDIKYNV